MDNAHIFNRSGRSITVSLFFLSGRAETRMSEVVKSMKDGGPEDLTAGWYRRCLKW